MTETVSLLIAIPAYDRPASLSRLLDSLARLILPAGVVVDLVVSIDQGGDSRTVQVANQFDWKIGRKQVLQRQQHLGLRRHIIELGSLLGGKSNYDAMLMVEDDLLVSPVSLQFAAQALRFYAEQDNIGGISLYCYDRNEYNYLPFSPLHDAHDCYFMQVPCSWGQVWTRAQWIAFQTWYEHNQQRIPSVTDRLPAAMVAWASSSWKKYFAWYLLETNRYIVYPRVSYSTNFSEPGTHQIGVQDYYQVPLAREFQAPRLCTLDQSRSVYDMHFEPENAKCGIYADDQLSANSIEFDLYCQKSAFRKETTHVIGKSPRRPSTVIRSWGDRLSPAVNNIIYGIEGQEIYLYPKSEHQKRGKFGKFINDNPVLMKAGYKQLAAAATLKLLGKKRGP